MKLHIIIHYHTHVLHAYLHWKPMLPLQNQTES